MGKRVGNQRRKQRLNNIALRGICRLSSVPTGLRYYSQASSEPSAARLAQRWVTSQYNPQNPIGVTLISTHMKIDQELGPPLWGLAVICVPITQRCASFRCAS